jgi:RNA exonuclease 4
MAVFRLHRKEWDKGNRPSENEGRKKRPKRKQSDHSEYRAGEENGTEDARKFRGGGKKGVSSGFSTVVKIGRSSGDNDGSGRGAGGESKWWKELGMSKGSMRVSKI